MFKDILLCSGGLAAIFVIPTIAIALIWSRARRRETGTRDTWVELAPLLGLTYEPRKSLGLPVAGAVNGQYRGRGIFLNNVREAPPLFATLFFPSLTEEKHFYRLWVGLNLNPIGELVFGKRSAFDKVISAVRGKETKIGNDQFDAKFVIKAESDQAAGAMFSSAFLQQKLIGSPPLSFRILKDRIESIFPPTAQPTNYWRSMIDLLCDVAEAVEGAKV